MVSGGAKAASDKLSKGEILQAVVICDLFSPDSEIRQSLSDDDCLSFVEVLDRPVIQYTNDWLGNSGIQHVFYCTSSASDSAKLEDYLSEQDLGYTWKVVQSERYLCVGDVLKDLFDSSSIEGHFVLTHIDTITNLNLQPILEAHKARYKQNKLSVLTAVYTDSPPWDPPSLCSTRFSAAVDPSSSQIAFFSSNQAKKLSIPSQVFENFDQVDLLCNLTDCGISICAPEVAQLFVDNFDYQNMADFITGILDNEEILGNQLFIRLLTSGEFASRSLTSLRHYDTTSLAMLQRKAYPLVPDKLFSKTPLSEDGVYISSDVSCSIDSVEITRDSLISLGCRIHAGCISRSVIGRNCTIGEKSDVRRSYIQRNAVLENNVSVTGSFVGETSVIRSGVTLKPGCVIGPGAVVGPNCCLGKVIISRDPDAGEKLDPLKYGKDCSGSLIEVLESGYEDWFNERSLRNENLGEDRSEDEDSSDDDAMPPPLDDHKLFSIEVQESILRSSQENIRLEDLVLEINSAKFAYNASMSDIVRCVLETVLNLDNNPQSEKKQWLMTAQTNITKFKALISHYVVDSNSQKVALSCLETYLSESYPALLTITPHLFLFLFNSDVIPEDVFIAWSEAQTSSAPAAANIRTQCADFIKWLQEAESSEEESD